MLSIAYICDEYPPCHGGGLGTFVETMATAMAEAGHRVTVVGMYDNEEISENGNLRIVRLKKSASPIVGNLLDKLSLVRWLKEQVRLGRINFIEATDAFGVLPFKVNSCPVVIRLHLSGSSNAFLARRRPPRPDTYFCERRTVSTHPHWIAVSQYVLDLTKSTFLCQPKESVVIGLPVTLPAPSPAPTPTPGPYLLFAGTLSERKGAFTLAAAARRVMALRPNVHLVYAGRPLNEGGRDTQQRILGILGAKLSGRVHFMGHVDRPTLSAYMHGAAVFTLPSILESFGFVVGEAMLAGVPVVVCDCGPMPEFVAHGQTGLLVPPKDAVALAAAIERLLDNPDLRQRLTRNALRSISTNYSVEKCLSESMEFYSHVEDCWKKSLAQKQRPTRPKVENRPNQ